MTPVHLKSYLVPPVLFFFWPEAVLVSFLLNFLQVFISCVVAAIMTTVIFMVNEWSYENWMDCWNERWNSGYHGMHHTGARYAGTVTRRGTTTGHIIYLIYFCFGK